MDASTPVLRLSVPRPRLGPLLVASVRLPSRVLSFWRFPQFVLGGAGRHVAWVCSAGWPCVVPACLWGSEPTGAQHSKVVVCLSSGHRCRSRVVRALGLERLGVGQVLWWTHLDYLIPLMKNGGVCLDGGLRLYAFSVPPTFRQGGCWVWSSSSVSMVRL